MRSLLLAILGVGIFESCVATEVACSDGLYVGLGMNIVLDKLQSDFISVPDVDTAPVAACNLYDSVDKTSYDPTILLGWSFRFDMPLFVALEASYSFANKKHSTLHNTTGEDGSPLECTSVVRNYQIGSDIRGLLKVGYKAQNYAAYVLGGRSSRTIKYVFDQPNRAFFDTRTNNMVFNDFGMAHVSLSKNQVKPVIGLGVRYACRDYALSFEVSKVWNRSVSRVTNAVDILDDNPDTGQRFHSMKTKDNIELRLTLSKAVNMF